jgi:hypothetical protein
MKTVLPSLKNQSLLSVTFQEQKLHVTIEIFENKNISEHKNQHGKD